MTNIPTTAQLFSDIKSDLETAYGESIPLIGKFFLLAFCGVQAAKLRLFYLGLAFLQKNIFIDTADPEAAGGTLERFGRVKLGRNPFPAAQGEYICEVTGTAAAVIAASTTFKSNDDSLSPGKLFVLDAEYILTGSGDVITLRALEAGTTSQLDDGDLLTATAPIANVNSQVEVQSELVEPFAAEDIEDYRRKGLTAYRLEPEGGAASDYRIWAADAQGVEQVYPYAKSGFAGEVNVFVEATEVDSTDGKGTPSGALLSDVEGVIELDPDTTKPINERGRRPLGVFDVHVLPITPLNVDIQITGFVGITVPIQTLILNALTIEIKKIRPFIAGADVLETKNDILDINKIIATIIAARPGSIFGAVQLTVNAIVQSTHTFGNGDIPFLNSITYV